jgi:hypothetical protein
VDDKLKLSEALAKVLEAAGMISGGAESIAEDVFERYPDLEKARESFLSRLSAQLNPSLNAATLLGLGAGAWDELKTMHPGFNRHTFGGG